jgi:hypothetical protein
MVEQEEKRQRTIQFISVNRRFIHVTLEPRKKRDEDEDMPEKKQHRTRLSHKGKMQI